MYNNTEVNKKLMNFAPAEGNALIGPEFCTTCELRDGFQTRMVHGRKRRKTGGHGQTMRPDMKVERVWHEVWACPRCLSIFWGRELFESDEKAFFELPDLEKRGF